MSKNIKELFIFPNYKIFVFEGQTPNTHYTVKGLSLCYGGDSSCKYVDTEFQNLKFDVSSYKMLGRLSNLTAGNFEVVFKLAGYKENKYPDFLNIDGEKLENAFDSFVSYLISEGCVALDVVTWIVIPKPAKKLVGKKYEVEFNVCGKDFGIANQNLLLPVYANELKVDTKEVNYSFEIPDYIYDYLMLHPEVEKRPKSKTFTSVVFSHLQDYLSELCNTANQLTENDKKLQEAEKVLLVKFEGDQKELRDGWVHASAGKKTIISYQFFVGYVMISSVLLGTKNVFVDRKWISGKGFVNILPSERKLPVENVKDFKIINWTQEREDFLLSIEVNFKKLSDNLNMYLSDLDFEKLDKLIENKTKLLS